MAAARSLALLALLCRGMPATGDFWTVTVGDPCTISGNCVQSPNFPSNYGLGERCTITVIAADWERSVIQADTTFYTEGCCDRLTVNGVQYSGSNAPNSIRPSGTITWTSDARSGVEAGWKLCPLEQASAQASAQASSQSSSSSSAGVIAGVATGGVALMVCAGAAFYFLRKRNAGAKYPSAAPPPVPPASIGVKPVEEAPDPERAGGGRASWIAQRATAAGLPPEERRLPEYWATKGATPGAKSLQEVSPEEQEAMQALLDSTFKRIKTRDRRSGDIPSKLKVVQVQRVENVDLWEKFASGRYCVKIKRSHKCTQLSAYGGEIATTGSLPAANRRTLQPRVNEVYMFHGTSPHGALGISDSNFRLSFAGTRTGMMYGPGVYFAECSSKSDEYASDDQDGIYGGLYCLILCRVVLGELLHMTAGGEATHGIIKQAMESDQFDSVLGDREASVGTYREFVIYQEDQVYPEYLILYKREK